MAWLRIEMDRGRGWELRADGEADVTVEDVRASLPGYALKYPHRALLDGELVATARPVPQRGRTDMVANPDAARPMTAARFRACLDLIGWTPHGLAARLRVDESRTRRWMAGRYDVPAEVAAWLELLAAFHKSHPIPPGWRLKADE